MEAKAQDGKVVVEMTYEEACDLGDVLAALSGQVYRYLPDTFRGFTTKLNTAAWDARPVPPDPWADQDDDDDQDDNEG